MPVFANTARRPPATSAAMPFGFEVRHWFSMPDDNAHYHAGNDDDDFPRCGAIARWDAAARISRWGREMTNYRHCRDRSGHVAISTADTHDSRF